MAKSCLLPTLQFQVKLATSALNCSCGSAKGIRINTLQMWVSVLDSACPSQKEFSLQAVGT